MAAMMLILIMHKAIIEIYYRCSYFMATTFDLTTLGFLKAIPFYTV